MDFLRSDYVEPWGYETKGPYHGGAIDEAGRMDEFMLNDEGWVVWVGEGNHYTEGVSKNLWGTSTTIAGVRYEWGIPFVARDAGGASRREIVSNFGSVDVGWGNTFRVGAGLSFNAQLQARIGREMHDSSLRVVSQNHPKTDQTGKPDELLKPLPAYWGLDGPGGAAHREDASFLKLRSIGVNYRLSDALLSRLGFSSMGMQSMSLGLVGRNVLNIKNCICADAESAISYTENRFGTERGYPPIRTFTADIAVTF
jgi:hypothetical protein